jgi:hypothetical protein
MQTPVKGSVRAKGTVEIIAATGNLVYRSKERKVFKRYEVWRSQWATQKDNRKLWMPRAFREGKITPLTLAFYLYLIIFKKSIYRRLTNG